MYLKDFIQRYGDVSFRDMPFCDGDNAALCKVTYMFLEKVVSDSFDSEPVRFEDACNRLFALNGNKHVGPGLVLPKEVSIRMMDMAGKKRWADIKCVGFKSVFVKNPAKQFGGFTFLLPDGNIAVVFRGTDDSIAGWKEDCDILTRKGIPSQMLGLEYLEEVASKLDGKIYVLGHSKGGNVALYSGVYCSQKTRDRIIRLYNNEGPGMCDHSFTELESYKELLPRYRHIVPTNSFIGMMLCHDDDYKVVRASGILGPLQHDLKMWKFDGNSFDYTNGLLPLGKVTDYVFAEITSRVDDDTAEKFDRVAVAVVDGINMHGLLDVSKNISGAVDGAVKAWKSFDKETRNSVAAVFSGLDKVVFTYVKEVTNGDFARVEEMAHELKNVKM